MKCLLIFLPDRLYKTAPGYIYGMTFYDVNAGVQKYYGIGLQKDNPTDCWKSNANIIGYCSVGEQDQLSSSLRMNSNWIHVHCNGQMSKNDGINYTIKTIICGKVISVSDQHTVLLIYDQLALQASELFDYKAENHFCELMRIVQTMELKNKQNRRFDFEHMKKVLCINLMFLCFYPIYFLSNAVNKLYPILKYSSLGLHINEWLTNTKWMLETVIKNKKFCLKTGNCVSALLIDMVLGILALQTILYYVGDASPSQILLSNAEKVVKFLKNLIHWLMGAPAGLKLNHVLNNALGKFFLYNVQLWWTFLVFVKPVMDLAFKVLMLIGRLGITFQIAIAADLLALVSFHTYCIYVYAARLFNIQLKGITALFRLFLGKKKNPLRERIDSCQYQPDQLFIGTLLFTILLFLLPTTWVYYIVFTILRLTSISCGGFLTRLKFYLQVIPIYTFFMWLFRSNAASSAITIESVKSMERPVTLLVKMTVTSWGCTWKKCMPDTVPPNFNIKWNKILSNILLGELLYPL